MKGDEDELDILSRKEERMKRKARPDIPRAAAEDEAPKPKAVRRDDTAPADAAPAAQEETQEYLDTPVLVPGPSGSAQGMPTPREDTDEEINDEPNENAETDDIPMGLFGPDSEEEEDKEPSAKRERA